MPSAPAAFVVVHIGQETLLRPKISQWITLIAMIWQATASGCAARPGVETKTATQNFDALRHGNHTVLQGELDVFAH